MKFIYHCSNSYEGHRVGHIHLKKALEYFSPLKITKKAFVAFSLM
jgi:hypothetical protein